MYVLKYLKYRKYFLNFLYRRVTTFQSGDNRLLTISSRWPAVRTSNMRETRAIRVIYSGNITRSNPLWLLVEKLSLAPLCLLLFSLRRNSSRAGLLKRASARASTHADQRSGETHLIPAIIPKRNCLCTLLSKTTRAHDTSESSSKSR